MKIDLKPETQRLVQQEIQSGHFQSVDELIVTSLLAWREKRGQALSSSVEQRREAVDRALRFAANRAISLGGVSIKELIHKGHRM